MPAASAGASSATSPSSGGSSGATIPTTPVGSGSENDRNGAATGLIAAEHGGQLVGPAGVVEQHVDGRVDLLARTPMVAARDSSASAARYRIWPRLYAVRAAHGPAALRAAATASRTSLRDARGKLNPSDSS